MRIHRPALAAALIGLVAATFAATSGATAREADAPATPTGGAVPLALPGLNDQAHDVTLLTGDRVTLTPAGGGHYSVAAIPRDGADAAVRVRAQGGAKGVTSVSAVPASASVLLTAGVLDANLFDPTWLAAHGDDGPTGTIPVTVQYGGKPTAATLTSKAAVLSGATLVATHPDSASVDLSVPAARAASFWAALTDPKNAAHLAGGASHAWTTGHRAAAVRPADASGLNQVTETISRTKGDVMGCNGYLTTLCTAGTLALYGLAGSGMGTVYPTTGFACVDSDPCTTYRFTFSVPNGVYFATGYGFFDADQASQQLDLSVPQVTVAGDTSFSVDANTATQMTIDTPRPSTAFTSAESNYRSAADGAWVTSVDFTTDAKYWAIPSQAVTVGTFHLSGTWVLGAPPLTMTANGTPLDASYFTYRTAATAGNTGAVRFTGHHKLPLVDVGYGRPEDYAGVDAHGKLVLIDIGPNVWCSGGSLGIVLDAQLNAAIQAGAAGLLVDPSTPEQYPGQWCSEIIPQWYGNEDPITMPFADLTLAKAQALRTMLAHGAVTVDVNGYDGNSPYVYTPLFSYEGRVPASLHATITTSQLTAVTEHLHADEPGTPDMYFGAWRPDEYFTGGTSYEHLATPGDFIEYRGPAKPDVAYLDELSSTFPQQLFDAAATRGGSSTEVWNAQPAAPGTATVSQALLRAQPGKWSTPPNVVGYCTFCRQGNTFYPIDFLQAGADPKPVNGAYAFTAGAVHLYRDGQELTPTPFSGPLVAFDLPADAARYRLTTRQGGIATSWDFTSSEPAEDRVPIGTACIGTIIGQPGPCAPDPLLLLRYDAGVDSTNSIATPGLHRLQVVGYHQAADAPAMRSLKVWTSTDGGTTWHPALVTGGRDGAYTALYTVPAPASTDGALSIKAQATDAGGNDITQTMIDAVQLAAGR